MLSFLVTLIVLVLAGLGALWGLTRGLNRSLVRFGVVVLSAVIAFILAASLLPTFVSTPIASTGLNPADFGLPNDATVTSLLQSFLVADPTVVQILEISPTLADFILMLPVALIAEIMFVLFFFVIKLILGFVQIFFNIFLLRKKNHRGYAALVGAVQGVFCALVLLVPVFGLVPMMDQIVTGADAIAAVDENGNKSDFFATIEVLGDNYCAPIKNDPLYAVFEFTGIRFLGTEVFYGLSNVTNEAGETHSVFREVSETVPAVVQALKLTEVTFDELSDEEVAVLQNLVTSVQESTFLRNVLSDLLINGSDAALNDGFLGLTIDPSDSTGVILSDLLTVLSQSERDGLIEDLPKVVDALVSVVDLGLFSGEEIDLSGMLSDTDATSDLLLSFVNSKTLSPVAISVLNNIGVTAIGNAFELSEEEINDLRIPDLNAFNNMTEVEREAEIAKIAGALSSLMDLSGQMGDNNDIEIIELFPQTGKMLNMLAGSTLLGDISKAVVNGILDNEAAQGFLNEKSIATIRAKMETGEINFENTLSSIAAAHKLSQSLNAKPSKPAEPSEPSQPSQPSNPDLPSNPDTPVVPDEPSLPDTPVVPDEPSEPSQPSQPSNPDLPSNPDTPVVPDEPTAADKFVEAVEDLFVSMDETTAEIMKETMTEQIVESLGVPEEGKDAASTIFDNLLDEMAKFEKTEETDFEKESAALESTLNFVTDVFEQPEEAITEEKLTEVLDNVLQSETVTNTIIASGEQADISEFFTEEQLENVTDILDNYVNDSVDSENVNATIEALKNLFGIGSSSSIPEIPGGFDPSLLPG